MDDIVNRVAGSSLVSLDLDEFMDQGETILFDIKEGLFQGIILKEKDFRGFIKNHDWEQYQSKNVAVWCSEEVIIPSWAYMLVVTKLQPQAKLIAFGGKEELEKVQIDRAIDKIMHMDLVDAKVVIKGCGEIESRDYAYFRLTQKLLPIVASIMYGEPCSTVPVYKKAK